jgi:hypothetical protein
MSTPAWEQQDGESETAYRHFCYFRDLGPDRTRDDAYRSYLRDQGREVVGTEQAPGLWTRECSEWGWVVRASIFDGYLSRIRTHAVVYRMVRIVDTYAAKVLQALQTAEVPTDFEKIIEAVQVLAQLVPPDSNEKLPRGDEPWRPRPEDGGRHGHPRIPGPGPGDSDERRSHDD